MKILVTLLMSLVLVSCATPQRPLVTLCIIDPGANGLDCYDPRTSSAGVIPYSSADKYVCFNPTDFKEIVNACQLQ